MNITKTIIKKTEYRQCKQKIYLKKKIFTCHSLILWSPKSLALLYFVSCEFSCSQIPSAYSFRLEHLRKSRQATSSKNETIYYTQYTIRILRITRIYILFMPNFVTYILVNFFK